MLFHVSFVPPTRSPAVAGRLSFRYCAQGVRSDSFQNGGRLMDRNLHRLLAALWISLKTSTEAPHPFLPMNLAGEGQDAHEVAELPAPSLRSWKLNVRNVENCFR